MTLLREMGISQVKEHLLPLQGKLWQFWCKKDKELYHLREKGNRSIEQHKSEIETEKQISKKQISKNILSISMFFITFGKILVNLAMLLLG